MALRKGRSLLKLRIKQAGYTQRRLAKELGVGESYISMVADNKSGLSYERAVNIAHLLGCNPKDLHEWYEVPLSQL